LINPAFPSVAVEVSTPDARLVLVAPVVEFYALPSFRPRELGFSSARLFVHQHGFEEGMKRPHFTDVWC